MSFKYIDEEFEGVWLDYVTQNEELTKLCEKLNENPLSKDKHKGIDPPLQNDPTNEDIAKDSEANEKSTTTEKEQRLENEETEERKEIEEKEEKEEPEPEQEPKQEQEQEPKQEQEQEPKQEQEQEQEQKQKQKQEQERGQAEKEDPSESSGATDDEKENNTEKLLNFANEEISLDDSLDLLHTTQQCQNRLDRLQYELYKQEYRLQWLEENFDPVEMYVIEALLRKEKKRKNVLSEFIHTEKNYIAALEILLKVYMVPLKEKILEKQLITDEQFSTIFFKIEDIVNHHMPLLEQMELIKSSWDDNSSKLSSLFDNLESLYDDYLKYVENYSNALSCLRECRKNSIEFSNLVDEECLESSENKNRYRIQDVLIMPIQKIPRYTMLLESFMKTFDDSYHDYKAMGDACTKIKEIAAKINEGKRYSDSIEEVFNLAQRIISEHNILDVPNRRALSSDILVESLDSNLNFRTIVLFSDSILSAKTKSEKELNTNTAELRVIWQAPLEDINVTRVTVVPDHKEVAGVSASLGQIERELQNESSRLKRSTSKMNIGRVGTNTKLDGLHLKLNEFQTKLSLVSRSLGVKIFVEGRLQHRVVTCLFSNEEDREQWIQAFEEAKSKHQTTLGKLDPVIIGSPALRKKKWYKIKSKDVIIGQSGRIQAKVYGITIQVAKNQPSPKVTFRFDVDGESGNFTSKGRIIMPSNELHSKIADIPLLHAFKTDVDKVKNVQFTVVDQSDSQICYGQCNVLITELDSTPRDFQCTLFSENSEATGNSICMQISFIR